MNCKHKTKCFIILPILVLSVLMTGCYENAWENHATQDKLLKSDLVEAIGSKAELSTFLSMLKKTGYDELLKTSNEFTVFAPTNAAWSGVDTSNVDVMRKLVGSLIVYKFYATDNENLYKSIKSVNGKNIFYEPNTQTFNGAKIITADVRSANGIIHITDKIVERKNNIWEYLSGNSDYLQSQYIKSLNDSVMDPEKSVAIGVNAEGNIKYDTIWKNINNFLQKYPLDIEDSVFTYIVVENDGFNTLYNKYKNYFQMGTPAQTDSITRFNVCQDFVIRGIVDITLSDTLTDVDGVKIPVKNAIIQSTYNASNGRVYIIKESNIRLKDKIKPIIIQGENYNKASDANYVFTRYKRWAQGERDIVLSCSESQSDSLWRKVPLAPDIVVKKDSVASKTYVINSGLIANVTNFYIEYKTNVNSANYDIYYVAYDDIADHFDPTYTSFGVYKVIQKLFISLPGKDPLKYGNIPDINGVVNKNGVVNNYLGDSRCFVGEDLAGVHKETKLKQWSLVTGTQLIESANTSTDSGIMAVTKTGTLTIWLCNTARSNAARNQGLLFLDYIKLVPRITEE